MRVRVTGRWIVAALCVVALLAAGRLLPLREWLDVFGRWIETLGPAAYALYVAAYIVVTVLMLPAVLLMVGAGLFFGLGVGVAVVSVGATLGAAAAFLIARHLARERVARAVSGNARYAAIDRAIGQKGWRVVFLLRLSPLVPFVLSNYFYGLTAIRFWPYVLSSWIGMLPLQFLYVSLGATAREVTGSPSVPGGPLQWVVLAGGILVTLVATIVATRIVRRAVKDDLPSNSPRPPEGGSRPPKADPRQ